MNKPAVDIAAARTDPKTPATSEIDTALERNRAFAAAGEHEGAGVIPALGLYVITCLDPRTDPAHFLGLGLSDAMVARNAGGRVTDELISDIAFIKKLAELFLPEGPLFEVAIIHHTECGTGFLADATFRHAYSQETGIDEATLAERAVVDPASTVETDVGTLRAAFPASSRIVVSGHVYDLATGLVETVAPAGDPLINAKS